MFYNENFFNKTIRKFKTHMTQPTIITVGQLYLNEDLNEYLIVTGTSRGQISYGGNKFAGRCEDETFLNRFEPVDPADVDEAELVQLLSLCPAGTKAKVGLIIDKQDYFAID